MSKPQPIRTGAVMKPPRRWSLVPAGAAILLALVVSSAGASNAYVANFGSEDVSVIDTATKQVVGTIKVGGRPKGIAITPDGKTAYVANFGSEDVSVIDNATKQVIGTIKVGEETFAIAISPDGKTAYVATGLEHFSVIDTQTNEVKTVPDGKGIKVGSSPRAIAITPDGKTAYVVNEGEKSVSVINTQTNEASQTKIGVGEVPVAIAITPDGKTAYVVNKNSGDVSVIETATNSVALTTIGVGLLPRAIAITPDGKTAYVVNRNSGSLSVIDIATSQVVDTISVGLAPAAIAISLDDKTAYVSGAFLNTFSVLDIATKEVVGVSIPVGKEPFAIALAPDLGPTAVVTPPDTRARPGVPISLSAATSKDPDGTIASYAWRFGEGQSSLTSSSQTTHAFSSGTYQVSLAVTDAEGCSTSALFIGPTLSCAGSPRAAATEQITVAYPGVRVSCPKSAKPKGCKVKLQVVSKKRKGKAESAVANVKLKAGRSAIVSIKPKAAFAAKLAAASSVLVKETVVAGHSTKKTRVAKLKVVQ
jgi:YVTN family beta-propeller protein